MLEPLEKLRKLSRNSAEIAELGHAPQIATSRRLRNDADSAALQDDLASISG